MSLNQAPRTAPLAEPLFVLAKINVSPTETAVTRPFSSIVAMFSSPDSQTYDLSEAFSGNTVAMSWTVSPTSIVADSILSVMDSTYISLTEIMQEAVSSEPSLVVAVMVAAPSEIAVTSPLSSIEAITESEETQVTDLSEALSGNTVAISFKVSPIFKETFS